VPQASGATKRLWGFDRGIGRGICVGYLARTEMQLKRFGTNVAKEGFHVLSHEEFQRVKQGRGSALDNFCATILERASANSIARFDTITIRGSRLASRTLLILNVKINIVLSQAITSDHGVPVSWNF
jgi:hypothetical protein